MSDELLKEIERLRKQVTELQATGSKHVIERQKMNAYGSRARRQSVIMRWAARVFGPNTYSFSERAMRLVEESIEVAQSVGVQEDAVRRIVTVVFSKPKGVTESELGGVAVTLMAMCEAVGVLVEDVERDELERVLSLDESCVRSKHRWKVEAGIAISGTSP